MKSLHPVKCMRVYEMITTEVGDDEVIGVYCSFMLI